MYFREEFGDVLEKKRKRTTTCSFENDTTIDNGCTVYNRTFNFGTIFIT